MKWKLTIRKEVKVVSALLALSLLIAFSERKQGGTVCQDVLVELDNVHENHFLDEADILRLIERSGQAIKGVGLHRIDLKALEAKIMYDKHILDAELYGDLKGNLVVQVELRRPMARIIQEDAPDAYIAEDGTVMGVSEKYTSRVVLVSGPFVKRLLQAEDLTRLDEGQQLLAMIRYINEDRFWKAQIAQLDIDAKGRVTLYPQVTGQKVEFGTPDNMEEKFDKLRVFYKEILPQRGWTRYDRVNLEYEGQVIAE
ncbi:MAG: cell division protein FtsQ/DivIB [Cyclobacteriaceae bacterium]|jgi:cell division protein FtsQ|nr:cell division protein FtsQ/DivIB [Cyclobacteriaceae bacterium]